MCESDSSSCVLNPFEHVLFCENDLLFIIPPTRGCRPTKIGDVLQHCSKVVVFFLFFLA